MRASKKLMPFARHISITGRRAAPLVRRAMLRRARRRRAVVGGTVVSARAVRALLGGPCGRPAIHSALRAGASRSSDRLLTALFTDGFEGFLYVLILYGVVIVIDGLLLQPVIMRRTARVPIWASLIVPILLSLIFGFWGWLLAAPLLAVIFAYRAYAKSRAPVRRSRIRPGQTPPGQVITGGQLISPEGSSGDDARRDRL